MFDGYKPLDLALPMGTEAVSKAGHTHHDTTYMRFHALATAAAAAAAVVVFFFFRFLSFFFLVFPFLSLSQSPSLPSSDRH
jgi:hypothetical protein